jgi:hypothetical protein
MKPVRIYLDDARTPIETDWIVVRSYNALLNKVEEIGLANISLISLDHDLDKTAMREWHTNTYHNYIIDYSKIKEKTGLDVAKWLIRQMKSENQLVDIVVHSANAIGSGNITGLINHYRHVNGQPQNCVRVQIPHTV